MKRYESQTLQIQQTRITWIDGRWAGAIQLGDDADRAFQSCPLLWDYLSNMGKQGWTVAATAVMPNNGSEYLMMWIQREA